MFVSVSHDSCAAEAHIKGGDAAQTSNRRGVVRRVGGLTHSSDLSETGQASASGWNAVMHAALHAVAVDPPHVTCIAVTAAGSHGPWRPEATEPAAEAAEPAVSPIHPAAWLRSSPVGMLGMLGMAGMSGISGTKPPKPSAADGPRISRATATTGAAHRRTRIAAWLEPVQHSPGRTKIVSPLHSYGRLLWATIRGVLQFMHELLASGRIRPHLLDCKTRRSAGFANPKFTKHGSRGLRSYPETFRSGNPEQGLYITQTISAGRRFFS